MSSSMIEVHILHVGYDKTMLKTTKQRTGLQQLYTPLKFNMNTLQSTLFEKDLPFSKHHLGIHWSTFLSMSSKQE